MKKGFTTLLTVAIALVSVQAMANAPVIGDIPSPVVGSTVSSTQPTAFVFQDAFNLEDFASDDVTAQNALKWTYEVVGTSKYLINGVQPINSASVDPSSPTLAQTINKTVAGSELNTDTKTNTITVRNQRLAPLGGTALATPAAGFYDTQAVTFWCSDGSAASSHTVFFYTQSGAASYLSQKGWKKEKSDDALNTGFDHAWQIFSGKFGNITTATWSGVGICFNTAQSGENFSDMAPTTSYFTLAANTVYRARYTMNCSQPAAGHTPFWDMIIENWPAAGGATLNLYGADNFYVDNEGGANTVVTSTGGSEISMYWAPAAFQTNQWNTGGLFSPANANAKDARMRFRVMDTDSNAPLKNNEKFGLLCMTKLTIESVPFSRVQIGTSKVNVTNFKQATTTGGGTVDVTSVLNGITGLHGTDVTFNPDGTLTLAPAGTDGPKNEIVTIIPMVTKAAFGTGRTNNDGDFPIAWVDDKTYIMQVDVSAPDATGQSHPWDVIWLNMEPPTNEALGESYVTSNQGYGSPKTGTPQTYTLFYNAMKASHTTQADFKFLRWRVRFGNSTTLNFPLTTDLTNTGSVKVHSVRVNEFTVQ